MDAASKRDSSASFERETRRVVVTDTTNLWTIDGVVKDYPDWRGEECLVRLVDTLIDPRNDLRCLFQTQELIGATTQKVPDIYRLLEKHKLLREETETNAEAQEIKLTDDFMVETLERVERWYGTSTAYPRAVLHTHRHKDVYDERRYRGMTRDKRDTAVPRVTHAFCQDIGKNAIDRIARTNGWTPEDVEFIYAIILGSPPN